MPSVRGACLACVAVLPVAVLLSGCVSTQTSAARVRLANARLVAATQPVEVLRANPEVRVGNPVLIRRRAGAAIVVSLRNDSSRALTDVPILVGVSGASGRKIYVNHAASEDYFASHVAAIGPHATTNWVFLTTRRVGAGHPFAVAGLATLQAPLAGALPRVDVSTRAAGEASGHLTVSVTNRSAIPQDDLPVYVVAVRAGHDVAAGQATVAQLGSHATTTLSISLLGNPGQAALRLTAVPTIFN